MDERDSSSDVQVCHQRLSSDFDLLLIFLCSLIQTLTLTPPPNNALLANMDMWGFLYSKRKTADTAHTAIFASNTRPLSWFWVGPGDEARL